MAEQMQIETFAFEKRKPIKGYPELHWTGKRPYESTQYFPAQLRERYGAEQDGWINKIFWGDNLQVMSHMLKEYRGKIDLVYIDPPFDSKADYKKKIKLKGQVVSNDSTSFEEKQYGDIWTNDEYLQFIYERITIIKELLSDKGVLLVHCDYHKSHFLRCILDEVMGPGNFVNEIIWYYETYQGAVKRYYPRKHDNIFVYSKSADYHFEMQYDNDYKDSINYKRWEQYVVDGNKIKGDHYPSTDSRFMQRYNKWVRDNGRLPTKDDVIFEIQSVSINSVWKDIKPVDPKDSNEKLDYPTQKPEALIHRIIRSFSKTGDIVFDCFMGSGTTQAVAMKLGRRFIGADINLGAIQTTTKRLIGVAQELEEQSLFGDGQQKYTGFEVYNVNNYDFFRNPLEAKELIISALEIQKFDAGSVYDGELDGRMVKILPINRIATKADLEELKANLPYKSFEKRKEENPNAPVEYITLVCMGHEPDLKASLEQELSQYKLDIQIVDILRDKSVLQLKREAEANVVIKGGKLTIKEFFPMNLMQKLSLQKEYVDNWKQLVESIMIDWNYDGVVMEPTTIDIAPKDGFVEGVYTVPADAGRIKVKITDLLSESLEIEVG
ncbi:MAG: site-specific DNA-methyltransferase [Clostridia bacterium]|nr:site-specific DNA-methyltransferase [Clostridia bacterium]